MLKFWKSFYLTNLFFYIWASLVMLMLLGLFWNVAQLLAIISVGVVILLFFIDGILLYQSSGNIVAARHMAERFSNSDANDVMIAVENKYPFQVWINLIDEVPIQFQMRDHSFKFGLNSGQTHSLNYSLTPFERGEYYFGALNVFVQSRLGLVKRRFLCDQSAMVKVYPSFIEMRKFELLAISNRLTEIGIKKIRKIGHQMEFDQIRDYIKGDDYRTINWKATARRSHLMVNQFQDEKSQQVISVIDMGRNMQMPFNGLSLLDYAINTSLVISDIAMGKHDKAGLVTFSDKVQALVSPRRSQQHLELIMETLYNQTTAFSEHDLAALYSTIRRKINHRSLLVLFTNFESVVSAQRQMAILKRLAAEHLLVVVFFENSEIQNMLTQPPVTMEEVYVKTIAEKFIYDKKTIYRELEQNGIHPILTTPDKLTVNAINKYLELKARGFI